MKRLLLAVLCAGLVAIPVMADITLRPGVSFVGSYTPSVTLETFVADAISAKFFVVAGEDPGFVASMRQWPDLASFDMAGNALPVYVGVGVITQGMDGQYVAGLYAEAGFRFAQMFDIGFAVMQAGATGAVMLNIGISFDFMVPTE